MNYTFQVVPAADLTLYHKLLGGMGPPIDRHQALSVGACAVLVTSLSDQCLAGIAQEKRELAVWVRNQRSAVRVVRFKGASKYRGALNADISNAADRAKNQLEHLRSFAPEARRQAELKFHQAGKFISAKEAVAYVPTFQSEVLKRQSAQQSRGIAITCLVIGVILLFIAPGLGLILILVAVCVWLVKRGEWQSLKSAEVERGRQIREIRQRQETEDQFAAEMDPNPLPEVDETVKPSIAAIASDLEKKYVLLDVACRDLNSQALSWDALAQEVLEAMNDSPIMPSPPRGKAPPPPPPPLPLQKLSQEKEKSSGFFLEGETSSLDSTVAPHRSLHFKLTLEEIQVIMQQLGYKRLPKDLDGLSERAQEKIGRFLAVRAGFDYEDYRWRYEGGEFKGSPIT